MLCPKCGKETPDNSELCQACGFTIQPTIQKKKISKHAVASMVLGIIGLLSTLYVSMKFTVPVGVTTGLIVM